MANQGSGGAFEISQRMTAMVGWGATANFTEDWTWDQAAATYALDPAMAEKLRRNNPQARCLSASCLTGSSSYHRMPPPLVLVFVYAWVFMDALIMQQHQHHAASASYIMFMRSVSGVQK